MLLYTLHKVETLGLIALVCQAPHCPVLDWLVITLTYPTKSANILSVATQVYLPFHRGAAPIFFSRDALHAHLGTSHLMEMHVGSHCMSLLVPLEGVLVDPVSAATALD
jgi:hypothetical protein